jgi:hypothetical protein
MKASYTSNTCDVNTLFESDLSFRQIGGQGGTFPGTAELSLNDDVSCDQSLRLQLVSTEPDSQWQAVEETTSSGFPFHR